MKEHFRKTRGFTRRQPLGIYYFEFFSNFYPVSRLRGVASNQFLHQKVAPLLVSCLGELFGTMLLTLVICTVVAAAVIAG